MSKVSTQNEHLPSFVPITQQKVTQKRKRVSAAFKQNSSVQDRQSIPTNKKTRTKKSSTKTMALAKLWIGATLMQEDNSDKENVPAAFSIFYGTDDSRNFTEKVSISNSQNIDHVYIMGVIRALEKFEDDSSALHIHTGSKELSSVINQDSEDQTCSKIKEKISKRKGVTYFEEATSKENEFQVAYKLASEKLLQEDAMVVDEKDKEIESKEVESLEIGGNLQVSDDTTATTVATEKLEVLSEEQTVATTTIEKDTINKPEEVQAPTSWMSSLSLSNLLDVLKAPFVRKNNNNDITH